MVRKVIAEVVGSFLLAMIGCGTVSIVQASASNLTGVLLAAITYGGLIAILVKLFGNVSGGHFNPAVSLAMFLKSEISGIELVLYIIAQVAGACLGVLSLKFLLVFPDSFGSPYLYDASIIKTIALETILSTVFVMSYLVSNSNEEKAKNAGIAYIVVYMFGATLDGVGLNPAKAFASMALNSLGMLVDYLPFLVGPFIGSLLASVLYKSIIIEKSTEISKKSKKQKRKSKEEKIENTEDIESNDDVQEQNNSIDEPEITDVSQPELEDSYDLENSQNYSNQENVQSEYGMYDVTNQVQPVPVDDTVYEDENGVRYYLYTDGNYYPINR